MQVTCPTCGALILSEDMNLANMVAKCRACNALVDLRGRLPNASAQMPPSVPQVRLNVPIPEGFVVDDAGPGLRITRRWFSPTFIFLAFFCIAWDSFLVFWYSMAFAGDAPWIMAVFPIVHLAVGIGLTYYTVAGFLNRTRIAVEDEELTIRHGPVPWFGNRRIPVHQVDQLYCQRDTRQSRNGVTYSYKVSAITSEGKQTTLVSGLAEAGQALFIEQQIERYLGIQDRVVPGELPR